VCARKSSRNNISPAQPFMVASLYGGFSGGASGLSSATINGANGWNVREQYGNSGNVSIGDFLNSGSGYTAGSYTLAWVTGSSGAATAFSVALK